MPHFIFHYEFYALLRPHIACVIYNLWQDLLQIVNNYYMSFIFRASTITYLGAEWISIMKDNDSWAFVMLYISKANDTQGVV